MNRCGGTPCSTSSLADASAIADAIAEIDHPLGSVGALRAIAIAASADAPPRTMQAYDAVHDGDALVVDDVEPRAAPTAETPRTGPLPRGKRSVDLPRWVDLDQETWARAAPHLLASSSCDSASAPLGQPPLRSSKLATPGVVGELTVQMERTTETPASSYGDLLERYKRERERTGATPVFGVPPSSYVCRVCHQPGHWKENCPSAPSAQPPEGYVCRLCNQTGHFLKWCPSRRPSSAQATGPLAGLSARTAKRKGAPRRSDTAQSADSADGAVDGGAKRSRVTIPPDTYTCNMCKEQGHWIQNCPLRARERAIDRPPPDPGYVCKKCGIAGHWVELCPARRSHFCEPVGAAGALALPSAESLEIGDELAEALEEEEAEPRATIARAVEVLGEEAARLVLVQTWQVEESGGLLRIDGTSIRRTPCGVFLWLVKQRVSAEERALIWPSAPEPVKS